MIGKTEIFYYALYLRSLAKVQVLKQKEAGRKLEEVIQYVEKNITEEEEKVNLYPYLVCLWIQVVGESIAATKKEKYLTAAFTLLKRDRKMYHVTEVLRQLISCKENQKKSCEEEKRAYGAICKTYEFFGKDTSFNSYEASPITWMFTMVGEYLRSHREKQGLTQERLSEGICAVEMYSRIEKGEKILKEAERILSYTVTLKEIGKGNHCYTRVELNLIHTLVMEYQKRKEHDVFVEF